jgi:hypothetical protein
MEYTESICDIPEEPDILTWVKLHIDSEVSSELLIKPFTNGIFSLRRNRILSRSKDFYERLILQLETSSNPKTGHYFERSWQIIFNCHVPQATTIVSTLYLFEASYEEEEKWLANAKRTCSLQHPMVIFTEGQERAARLKKMRSDAGVSHITEVIELPFNELIFAKKYSEIDSNRNTYWPTRDFRCHTNIHILMMSRIDLVASVARRNPFKSTHVCQMDINMLTKKPNGSILYTEDNVFRKLDAIFARPRPLCTLMIIEPWDKTCFDDLREFYSRYRYQVAGTFWTADIASAKAIARKFNEVASSFTTAGYGHGDEHILARTVDILPQFFTLSMGDYQDIIENYFKPSSNLERVRCILKTAQRIRTELFTKLCENNNMVNIVTF